MYGMQPDVEIVGQPVSKADSFGGFMLSVRILT